MKYFLSTLIAPLWYVSGQATPAPMVIDNWYGVAYSVALVHGPGPLAGTFDFKAVIPGVQIGFNINGFNTSDEISYTYHIHEKPVPSDGNCNATGDHFDPYHVGADHKCDPGQPDLCQIGDLSGKHGAITANTSIPIFQTSYRDNYLSTNEGDIAFFANLSVVVHRKRDSYRLNCGNFTLYGSPIFRNGSMTAPTDTSAGLTLNSSAMASTTGMFGNVTSTDGPIVASTSPSATKPSVPTSSHTSIVTTSHIGNLASTRIEASLWMLGLVAVIPVVYL